MHYTNEYNDKLTWAYNYSIIEGRLGEFKDEYGEFDEASYGKLARDLILETWTTNAGLLPRAKVNTAINGIEDLKAALFDKEVSLEKELMNSGLSKSAAKTCVKESAITGVLLPTLISFNKQWYDNVKSQLHMHTQRAATIGICRAEPDRAPMRREESGYSKTGPFSSPHQSTGRAAFDRYSFDRNFRTTTTPRPAAPRPCWRCGAISCEPQFCQLMNHPNANKTQSIRFSDSDAYKNMRKVDPDRVCLPDNKEYVFDKTTNKWSSRPWTRVAVNFNNWNRSGTGKTTYVRPPARK
jgi:hypothetical protein